MLPADFPERAVDPEIIMRFFAPPIGKSTFYDLVAKGRIVPLKHVRGRYRLNESLARLGMPPVRELPTTPDPTEREQRLVAFALHLAAPDIVAAPSWLLDDDDLTVAEKSHVVLTALQVDFEMRDITGQQERLGFVQGVLDAFHLVHNSPPPGESPGLIVVGERTGLSVAQAEAEPITEPTPNRHQHEGRGLSVAQAETDP